MITNPIHTIKNPCRICIVRSMCKDPCDNLVSYIKIVCDDDTCLEVRYDDTCLDDFYNVTAKRIENGSAKLTEKEFMSLTKHILLGGGLPKYGYIKSL